jgi:hypothetical protein
MPAGACGLDPSHIGRIELNQVMVKWNLARFVRQVQRAKPPSRRPWGRNSSTDRTTTGLEAFLVSPDVAIEMVLKRR